MKRLLSSQITRWKCGFWKVGQDFEQKWPFVWSSKGFKACFSTENKWFSQQWLSPCTQARWPEWKACKSVQLHFAMWLTGLLWQILGEVACGGCLMDYYQARPSGNLLEGQDGGPQDEIQFPRSSNQWTWCCWSRPDFQGTSVSMMRVNVTMNKSFWNANEPRKMDCVGVNSQGSRGCCETKKGPKFHCAMASLWEWALVDWCFVTTYK